MKTKEVVLKIREQVYVDDEPFNISDEEAEKLIQLYSDQQNKELREEMMNRLSSVNEAYSKELVEKDAEIERLKKEVELLKDHKRIAWESAKEHQQEITRLRELLAMAKEEISSSYMTQSGKKELLEKIDNTLNHKP